MDMKRLVLISSYCDTDEKIETLKQNLIKLKKLELDTLLISPINLDCDIIKLCNYYFYTEENPLLCYPERLMSIWSILDLNQNTKLKLVRGYCDYGWASLLQIKRLLQIGLFLNYDYYIQIIYDIILDDDLLDIISEEQRDTMFKRIDPNQNNIHECSGLFILCRNTASDFEKLINEQTYREMNGFGETLVCDIKEKLQIMYSEKLIKDSINLHFNISHHNFSKNHHYKLFFSKNEHNNPNFNILIYALNQQHYFEIIVNDRKWEYFGNENILINTDIVSKNIKNIKIICDGDEDLYEDEFYEMDWSDIEIL